MTTHTHKLKSNLEQNKQVIKRSQHTHTQLSNALSGVKLYIFKESEFDFDFLLFLESSIIYRG